MESATEQAQERTVVEGAPASPAAADEVGAEIGRYLVIDEIGAGGMGRVFRAYDPKLGREVALKRLRLRAHGGETDGARMLREAKAMALLSHPNVVSIYDVDIDQGSLFIAMEYVRGATLKTWVVRGEHGWREVLAMFVQAGRGLAAAHAQGIVHRDFKPSNVVVGEDGRPRVMDFGLARAVGDAGAFEPLPPALAHPLDVEGESHGGSGDLGATLTAHGTVVGTPPYMAPEQHLGEAVDARTDQYAFCVALWEALHRRPAFAGRDAGQLAAAKLAGPPKGPTGTGVPAPLHGLLVRGLAVDPRERWPDMASLLDALERAATPRRWVRPAAAALLGIAFAGVWWWRSTPACATSEAELADTWGPEARARVEAGLRGSKAVWAETTLARVTAVLDADAAAWVAMHRDACAATKIRHEQSDEALDLRMGCLRARERELAGVIDLLAGADAKVTERAVELASGLVPIERCADVAALRERVPPPEQAAVRDTVDDVRARLADARMIARAGRLEDGLALAEAARADAQGTEYVPVEIEAELAIADLLVLLDRDDDARPLLEHALDTGLAQRDGHAAGGAAVELAGLLMRKGSRIADTRWLARMGLGLAEGDGSDPQLIADAMIVYGEVLAEEEVEREAEPYFAGAVALLERTRGPDHPSLVAPLISDAQLVRALGRHEEAKGLVARALAIVEASYGPDHPQVASALREQGWFALMERRFEDAEDDFTRAQAIAEAAFGPEHSAAWTAMGMRATAMAELHRYPEAIELLEASLRRMDGTLGESHPTRASTLHNVAHVHALAGDHARAVEILREVVRLRRAFGHQSMLAAGLGALGTELEQLERFDEAETVLAEASEIERAAHADDGLYYAYADTALARLARRRGDLVRAREILERGVAQVTDDGDPGKYADTKFLLAQVLWELGEDRQRAIALVEDALARVGELPGDHDIASAAEMRAWLEAHRPKGPPPSIAPHG